MPCVSAVPPYPTAPRPSRLITAACAAVALTILVTGCGSSAASAIGSARVEKPDLTVAVAPATSVAGLYVAHQRGYFSDAGLSVKIVPVASGVDALPSRAAVEQALRSALHISEQTAAVMALGTYPLTMTTSDLQRVAVLMQDNGLLSQKVNTTLLVKEMTGR